MKSKDLLNQWSRRRFLLKLVLFLVLPLSFVALRFYVLDTLWNRPFLSIACQIAVCKKELQHGDLVFFRLTGMQNHALGVLNFHQKGIPQKGDSLVFAQLNSQQMDHAIRILQRQTPHKDIQILPIIHLDSLLVPSTILHQTQIRGIPVRPQDISSLEATDLEFLQEQLRLQNPGTLNARIDRKILVNGKPYSGFRVKEDYFHLLCAPNTQCPSKQGIGIVPRSAIQSVVRFQVQIPQQFWLFLEYGNF